MGELYWEVFYNELAGPQACQKGTTKGCLNFVFGHSMQ